MNMFVNLAEKCEEGCPKIRVLPFEEKRRTLPLHHKRDKAVECPFCEAQKQKDKQKV